MSTETPYKKGLKVWIPHINKVWELAVILEDYDTNTQKLVVESELAHEIKALIIKSNSDLPPLCYSEDFEIDERKNLASLRVLHEACILNTLRLRFENRHVYNYCGATTVFLNPFLKPTISEVDNTFNYQGQTIDVFQSHIFAVVEKIYCRLERENHDQSIIFTGKSGAGKTENAKQAVLYLVTVSAKEDQIKQNILASSIILESFGNAKTINNDNSSRFGKFIEVQYDADYHIIGASVIAFLLDRSRLVHQNQNEQNFNIFYELRSVNEYFPHLQLDEQEFNYLNKGDSPEICLNYPKRFDEVIQAFNVLGFSVKQQNEILLILSAILHLGNLSFKKCDIMGVSEQTESCFISGYLNKLERLARLLSLDVKVVKAMRKWMTHRRMFSGQNEILQPMSVVEAMKARDTLAKFLYSKLFIWIVARINFLFRSPCNVQSFIGILDVGGFEELDVNLFEQFCINYANEKVEQNFIQSVFKSEQEEYLREDIGWNFMRYQDNRLCVELLEGKHGIIDILEEETKVSKDSKGLLVDILYRKCETAKNFKKPDFNDTDFIIRHFVNHVQYDSSEFLEKNRDTVFREHLGMLKDTKNDILNKIVMDEYYKTSLPREKRRSSHKPRVSLSVHQNKKMVISEIRKSLTAVTSTVQSTTAHYVICMKSNDERKSCEFNPLSVAQQMRSYNIFDAIQISAKGFCSRQTYAEFFHRYYCLCQFEGIRRDDLQETCRMIVYTYIEDLKNVKFGKTKIFLKEESIYYLENLRQEKQNRASILIQKTVRRFLQQKRYQEIRQSVLGLQCQVREYLMRRRARKAAENHAAVKIQTWFRKWMSRRRQQRFERTALALQNYAKLYLERNDIVVMDETQLMKSAATEIQRLFRGFLARRICEKRLRDIITMQACVRRFLAKIAAEKLRKNRDERVRLLNKGLETKIDALQQKIDTYMKNNLTTKQLEEVEMIVDDQQCIQAKNRILNQILFSKIQTLKVLGEKKAKTLDTPVTNDKSLYEESRRINKSSLSEVFKSLIYEEEDFMLYKPMFQTYFNFDQRIQKIIRAFGFSQSQLAQSRSFRKNAKEDASPNNQLCDVEINNYQGMFELNISEINLVLTRLIIELRPSLITEQEPGIPARILFMCLRYIDRSRDLKSASLMLQSYIKAVKYIVKKRGDLETMLIWLLNTYQLLNYLKQYSKIHNNVRDNFHTFNNDRQTEQCLVNLDLTARWGSLLETAQWLARTAEKLMKTTISDLTLLGLLEYNPVPASYTEDYNEDEEREDDVETEMAEEDGVEMEVEVEDSEEIERMIYGQEPEQNQTQRQKQELPQQQAQEQVQESILGKEQEQKLELPQQQVQEQESVLDEEEQQKQELPQQQGQVQEQQQEQIQELPRQQGQAQEQEQEQELPQQQGQAQEQESIQDREQNPEQELVQLQMQAQESIQGQERNEEQEPAQQQAQAQEPVQGREQNQEQQQLVEAEYNENVLKIKRDTLLQKLTDFHQIMRRCGIDRKMILQMFKQLFDFISSILLSNILSRPELCNCYRGSLARLNLSTIDEWALNNDLTAATIVLGPIKQALRLLQMQPLYDDEVYWISKFYDKLNCDQILKILSCYKPAYAVDKPLSSNIISRLQLRLAMRQEHENTVLIGSEDYSISFPFRHCILKLEEVEIPETFNLSMLRKI